MSDVTATSVDISIVLQDNNGKTFRLNIAAPVQSMTSLTLQEIVSVARNEDHETATANNSCTTPGAGVEVVELLDSSIDTESSSESSNGSTKDSSDEYEEEVSGKAAESADEAEELPVIKKNGRPTKTKPAAKPAAKPVARHSNNTAPGNRSRSTRTTRASLKRSDSNSFEGEEAMGLSQEFF